MRRRLPPGNKARKAVEEVAKKLAERFEIEYEWDGDDLHFNRSGVDGKIALKDSYRKNRPPLPALGNVPQFS